MLLRKLKHVLGTVAYNTYGSVWNHFHTPTQEPSSEKTKILVINLLRIGDTIVTLPALESLRAHYSNATISLVVRDLVAPLFEDYEGVDQLIVHQGDNSKASCRSLQQRLPESDLVVVFDTSPWTMVAGRSVCNDVLGYDSLGRGFAATRKMKAPVTWNVAVPDYPTTASPVYQGQAWHNLIETLGVPKRQALPRWDPPHKARQKVVAWLRSKGLAEFMVFHPGSDASYQWPLSRFKELVQKQDRPVVVGGGPDDRKLMEELVSVGALAFEGFSLSEYGALLSKASHVVSVDTSAAHLAAAVGTPLTVLFGPGDPDTWRPRGRAPVQMIQGDSSCLGCKSASCHQSAHLCMEAIDVEMVQEALS